MGNVHKRRCPADIAAADERWEKIRAIKPKPRYSHSLEVSKAFFDACRNSVKVRRVTED